MTIIIDVNGDEHVISSTAKDLLMEQSKRNFKNPNISTIKLPVVAIKNTDFDSSFSFDDDENNVDHTKFEDDVDKNLGGEEHEIEDLADFSVHLVHTLLDEIEFLRNHHFLTDYHRIKLVFKNWLLTRVTCLT